MLHLHLEGRCEFDAVPKLRGHTLSVRLAGRLQNKAHNCSKYTNFSGV
jgi:hypothetical protein